jgi:hypothetical protein
MSNAKVFVAFALFCLGQNKQVLMSEVEVPDGSSSALTVSNFVKIRQFILVNGLSRTYSQMYNHNPFYGFTNFNTYLNPDVGQANINCDRTKSGFSYLVIQTSTPPYRYWDIIWNRKRNSLIVRQAWSKIPSQALIKEVESILGQILNEIGKKQ